MNFDWGCKKEQAFNTKQFFSDNLFKNGYFQ